MSLCEMAGHACKRDQPVEVKLSEMALEGQAAAQLNNALGIAVG
jgi:hypothetical protein